MAGGSLPSDQAGLPATLARMAKPTAASDGNARALQGMKVLRNMEVVQDMEVVRDSEVLLDVDVAGYLVMNCSSP